MVTTPGRDRECQDANQSVLNRVEKFKPPVYGEALEERDGGPALVVQVLRGRTAGRSVPVVGDPARRTTAWRSGTSVPLWGIVVYLAYRMRRGMSAVRGHRRDGPLGRRQEPADHILPLVPATWARRLSWSEVASIYHTSWDSVSRAVGHAVEWGLAPRPERADRGGRGRGRLGRGTSIDARLRHRRRGTTTPGRRRGADERACGRAWMVWLDGLRPGPVRLQRQVEVYLRDRRRCAVHVLDRFHVMQKFGRALDEIGRKRPSG
ncbi:MAG: hypothetical protein WKF75_21010 [Singulisphaera sp.]